MKIFGFVVMREKEYSRIISEYEEKRNELETKIGALEYDKKRLGDVVAVLENHLGE